MAKNKLKRSDPPPTEGTQELARVGASIFEQIPIGGKKNLAYIFGDGTTREVAVVDAGFRPDKILNRLEALDASVKYVLATHGHRDHIGAAPVIKKATGAPLAAYRTVAGVDVQLADGDELRVGSVLIRVIHTPGHSPDGVCFLIDGKRLLTGDTLYVGRAPKAPTAALMRPLYESLHQRLMGLDDAVEVWPGHDVGTRRNSTIGEERRHNQIILMSFSDFCNRKWDRKTKRWVV